MSEFLIVAGFLFPFGRLGEYELRPDLSLAEAINGWQTYLGCAMVLVGVIIAIARKIREGNV